MEWTKNKMKLFENYVATMCALLNESIANLS